MNEYVNIPAEHGLESGQQVQADAWYSTHNPARLILAGIISGFVASRLPRMSASSLPI